MTEERRGLLTQLRKGEELGESDWLRGAVRAMAQELMKAEVSAQIGAERYERSDERVTQRSSHRSRAWDTWVGTLELAIRKLRPGSYFPKRNSPAA